MNKNLYCCCNQELTQEGKYFVCKRCKTVAFIKDSPFEEICISFNQYLDDIQKKISTKQDFLYDLEQRHMLNQELTAEEQEIRDKVTEFQNIYRDLKHETREVCGANIEGPCQNPKPRFCGKSDSVMTRIEMLLYRLLMISDWLNEKFGQ